MFGKQVQNSYSNAPYDKPSPFLQNRPQTPLVSLPSNLVGNLMNRNYKMQHNQQHHRHNISKSQISASSEASQLAALSSQPDLFPEDLVFILRNEQKNINGIKDKIEKEKLRVENDFSVMKAQIGHILEDVKISVQAELDIVYKSFITKYAELKGEVQELRIMRKELLMQNSSNMVIHNHPPPASNKDLISEIQKDAEYMRQFRIYGYLSELQRQKLDPILVLSNELIMIGSSQSPFYRHKEMTGKLKEIKQNFHMFIGDVFTRLGDFVVTPQDVIEKDRQENENNKAFLKDLEKSSDVPKNRNLDNLFPSKPRGFEQEVNTTKLGRDRRAQSHQLDIQKQILWVGASEQTLLTRNCEDISLAKVTTVTTDHTDAILCVQFLLNRYIATGSKDKTINIYLLEGKKVATLKGHDAAICCLSTLKNANGDTFLASGSDHGCSSLILWETRSWTMMTKVQSHTAAVTTIIDLQDGRHLVTGSYDKRMNLFNYVKGQSIATISNNRTSITAMAMSIDKGKLITSGLDNSLTVWQIVRKNKFVEQIVLDRVINNNSLVCQLQASILRPEMVIGATRDGTVKIFNISNGEIEKSFPVNTNSLIQLVAIERETKADSPIVLTCSSKDSSLVLTKMDTGQSSLLKTSGNLSIEFGCGIGPKVVVSDSMNGMMVILSQNTTNRQFGIYNMDLKSHSF